MKTTDKGLGNPFRRAARVPSNFAGQRQNRNQEEESEDIMDKFKAMLTWQGILVVTVISATCVWVWMQFVAPRIAGGRE